MIRKKRAMLLGSGLLVVCGCMLFAATAVARRPLAARPTVVVGVDLSRVIDALEQRARAQSRMQSMVEQTRAEDESRKAAITDLEQQIQELPEADATARRELLEKRALMLLEHQAWKQFALEEIDIEKSLQYRDLYRTIRRQLKELCAVEGYDIVVTIDSEQELIVNPDLKITREDQVKSQMNSRRILYLNASVDITDELIERMNNAFVAGS